MSKIQKIIQKMIQQPNGIRPEEAEKVLNYLGYTCVRQKGSHKQYLKHSTGELTTIKQDNPLKKVYIMDILNRLNQQGGVQDAD